MNSFLTRFVREKIVLKWSPQQMSEYVRIHMNISVSTKAIYKFIRTRGLTHYLFWSWNKRKTGRKRYTYNTPKDERKYIDVRPQIEGYGHYEMDFIVSKHNSTVLLVVVEMKSKYTYVLKLPNRKRITIDDALSGLFRGVKVESLTTDNDIAFMHWSLKRFSVHLSILHIRITLGKRVLWKTLIDGSDVLFTREETSVPSQKKSCMQYIPS